MPVTQLRVAGPGTPNARPEWSGEHSRALIERLPHSNADLLTFDGVRVAVFSTGSTTASWCHYWAANTPPGTAGPPASPVPSTGTSPSTSRMPGDEP